MAEPRVSVCAPWATAADVGPPCSDYAYPQDVLEDMLDVASGILFELSGRQWPGGCDDTVRPCGRSVADDGPISSNVRFLTAGQWGGRDWRGYCSCNRGTMQCGCSRLSEISLRGAPVITVDEVKVNGVVLDPSQYRVDEHRWLVRLADDDGTNPGWPCCQRLDLQATDDDTFEVSYTYGTLPPPAGVMAAAVLGCQLALSMNPDTAGKCKLPKRVTNITRNGMNIQLLDPQMFLDRGKTGIYEVDLFLAAYNPTGKRQRAQAVNVDLLQGARRIDTGA